MFPQFGATADTLSKASTMVFRIGTDAHLYDDPEDGNIVQLLDSKFDSEKCEALKRLLALIAQGFDVSNFFPQVVKNVASQYLEVKKLVYLYLLHYAEKRPSEALLSINCFQKDLGDPNPLVRAWALRTMAGIRLHVVAPIVLVAVGKCSRDPSVYVRKCAANALPKLYELRIEENNTSIEEIIGILLNDHSPGVVGAAAAAFATVCPSNFSLIDKSYRRLCQILPDVEEWGQIVLIDILLRYVMAKHGLVKESLMSFLDHHSETSHLDKDGSLSSFGGEENGDFIAKDNSALASIISRSYIEGPDEFLSRSSLSCRGLEGLNTGRYTSYRSNDDVKILLQCTSPLLWSYNSAVVIGAAGVHWIMAPMEDVNRIVKPLLFVLRSSNASRYVVLCNVQVFARAIPSMFAPYFEDFFISSSDTYQIRSLKLDILSSIASVSSISAVLKEFQDYIRDPDRRFAADTIRALGICAQRLPTTADTCLDWLLALTRQEFVSGDFGLTAEEAGVLTQIIMSIHSIVKQNPSNHEKVIAHLLRRLDSIKVPAARAMIIWMVGEYNSLGKTIPKMLVTILKYLACCFKSEASEAKLQILTTAVKVLSNFRGENYLTVKKIVHYVLDLAEFDLNYDIRDRARLLKKLLELNTGPSILGTVTKALTQNSDAQCILSEKVFGGKLKPVAPEASNRRFYLPGSLSQIVLHAAPAYEPLPKPCSLVLDGSDEISNNFRGMNLQAGKDSKMDDDSEASSGSLDEESASDYSSQQSVTGSTSSEAADIYDNGSASEEEDNGSGDPLIQILESENAPMKEAAVAQHSQEDIGELMSKTALESWLDEQSSSTNKGRSEFGKSTARITLGDIGNRIKPKSYPLLDAANGNGLKVDYSFSSQVSSISPLLICVDVYFKNCTAEQMSRVTLVDAESVNSSLGSESSSISDNDIPSLIPVEEIGRLDPGQTVKRSIQVRFHHHLLPLKLTIVCNDKKIPVKLRPDIGYFVKPLPMDIQTFIKKESRLPGMFEYERRCNFIDHLEEFKGMDVKDKLMVICESIALKMLGGSNLFPVCMEMPVESKLDDATGLCLRFSCEILNGGSVPCLITVMVEGGKCWDPIDLSVKVNCQDTVFGLNLLNRVVNFLVTAQP